MKTIIMRVPKGKCPLKTILSTENIDSTQLFMDPDVIDYLPAKVYYDGNNKYVCVSDEGTMTYMYNHDGWLQILSMQLEELVSDHYMITEEYETPDTTERKLFVMLEEDK